MEKKRFRRRNYLIDKDLQKKIIIASLVIVALVVVLSGIVAYQMLEKEVASRLWSVHLSGTSTWDFILPIILKINIVLFVAIWALVGLILNYRLKKLGSSLSRFKHHIAAMDEGRLLEPIRFRKGDPLVALAESCNSMNGSMRKRLCEVALKIDEMKTFIEKKKKEGGEPEEVRNFCQHKLNQINEYLSGIKM